MEKHLVKCPCKKENGKACGNAFFTKKTEGIQCFACGGRFNLNEGAVTIK